MAREFDQLESVVRRRARSDASGYPSDLQGIYPSREAPPPSIVDLGQRYRPGATFDQRFGPYDTRPDQDLIRRLFENEQQRQTPGAIQPGYQERFGDPTKVISDLPPSLGAVDRMQVADVTDSGISAPQYTRPLPSEFYQLNTPPQNAAYPKIPQTTTTSPGFYGRHTSPDIVSTMERMNELQRQRLSVPGRAVGGPVTAGQPYVVGEQGPEVVVPQQSGTVMAAGQFPLPEGFTTEPPKAAPPKKSFPLPKGFTTEPPIAGKMGRFLQNVTPEGPISGLIGLVRTAGEAAQGRRPDLLTNPEGAIPEAVQGAVVGPGARGAQVMEGLTQDTAGRLAGIRSFVSDPRGAIERGAGAMPKIPPRPEPYVPPEGPLALTSRLSPEEAGAIMREQAVARAREEASRVRADMLRQREAGAEFVEPSGPPAVTPPQPGQVPQTTQLLPPQLTREFAAVRRGVELKEKMNPASVENLSARDQTLAAAIRPHLNSIEAVGRRTQAPIAALEAALPSMSEAVSTPGKAASVANWVRVYERAARGKFSPQAKASLDLATRNLNNNLGTDLTLADVLKE